MKNLHQTFLKQKVNNFVSFIKFQRKFIGQGATYQTDTSRVKLRGKLLKCKKPDMPTLIWLPEVMDQAESFEKFFTHPKNEALFNRNIWLLNPRNFGNSDHHDSFSMDEVVDDIRRFMDDNKLTIATIGGHGYGAKIACAFGSSYLDRTSGVMCLEGGPVDITYHQAWHDTKHAIDTAYKLSKSTTSSSEFIKKLDKEITHPMWGKIIKKNIIEGSSGLSFKFNLEALYRNSQRHRPDVAKFDESYGLFPGRAFVQFASHSEHILLATNTIPIYKFFPKLEGCFISSYFNFIQCKEGPLSKLFFINKFNRPLDA